MKRLTVSGLSCFILLFGSVPFTLALDYAESSQGLATVSWEGGRSEIEMADVNLDGNIDLIAIGDHGNPYVNTQEHGIMFYAGDGRGAWTLYQNGDFGYGGIAVGDLNNDGLPDLGYGMHHDYSSSPLGDDLLEAALGDGTGQNWTAWGDGLATAGETWGMFASDFGDVDNDGLLDLGSTSFGYGNPLHVYLNNGNGIWTHSAALSGGNCGMHIFFGDINKDGNLDVVTSYNQGSIFFGTGDGQFYNAMYNIQGMGTYGLNGVSLGDVDGDGGMDVAFTSNGGVRVWTFNENTTTWVDVSGNLPTSGSFSMTQLWDMNGDGFCDVIAGGSAGVTVWTGNGQGNWTQSAQFSVFGAPFNAFRVGGDIDHNGCPDMVLLDSEGSFNPVNHLRVYKETSVPQALTVKPLFPHGGEVFRCGSARFTNWLSAVPGAASSRVKVELSSTGSSGPWTVLGDSLPNNGRLQWIIPAGVSSGNCYLRYTVTSGANVASATTPNAFTIFNGTPSLQVTLTPQTQPVIVPQQGGTFQFTASVSNNGPVALPFYVWARIKNPDGTYTAPTLGPVLINPPIEQTISRIRTQSIPGTWPAGSFYYLGYANITVSYPAAAVDSFPFTKSTTISGGPLVWDSNCTGEPFPGEEIPPLSRGDRGDLVAVSPNPFNPTTALSFQLSAISHVSLQVYDVSGRLVSTLVDGMQEAGTHTAAFDGSDLPSGIYFARLQAGSFTAAQKLVLLK